MRLFNVSRERRPAVMDARRRIATRSLRHSSQLHDVEAPAAERGGLQHRRGEADPVARGRDEVGPRAGRRAAEQLAEQPETNLRPRPGGSHRAKLGLNYP